MLHRRGAEVDCEAAKVNLDDRAEIVQNLPTMDMRELSAIAKDANADPRTVMRFLSGLPLKVKTKARVVAALKKHATKGKR